MRHTVANSVCVHVFMYVYMCVLVVCTLHAPRGPRASGIWLDIIKSEHIIYMLIGARVRVVCASLQSLALSACRSPCQCRATCARGSRCYTCAVARGLIGKRAPNGAAQRNVCRLCLTFNFANIERRHAADTTSPAHTKCL